MIDILSILSRSALDNKTRVESMAAVLASEVNTSKLDPLQRFMVLSLLKRACEQVLADAGTDATNYALNDLDAYTRELALTGKDFAHLGQTYRIIIREEYNYGSYSPEWRSLNKQQEQLKEHSKQLSLEIRAAEKRVLLEHPKMDPTKITMSMSLR